MSEERGTFSVEADAVASCLATLIASVIKAQSGLNPHEFGRHLITAAVDELGMAIEHAMAAMVIGSSLAIPDNDGDERLFLIVFQTKTSTQDGTVVSERQSMVVQGKTKEQVSESFMASARNTLTRRTDILEVSEYQGEQISKQMVMEET